jgi:hypothetical protein
MGKAKMKRRKLTLVLSISMLCLLVVVLAMIGGSNSDIFTRIEREINNQGYCMISGAREVEIQAQSARMEKGGLVLHGSGKPGEEPSVLVTLFPEMGSAGICSAKSVSIERAPGRYERLKLTFHEPTYLPRHMVGRSCYVSLHKMSWIGSLRREMRDQIRYILRQRPKKQTVSP